MKHISSRRTNSKIVRSSFLPQGSKGVGIWLLTALAVLLGLFISFQIRTAIELQQNFSESKGVYLSYQEQISTLQAENGLLKEQNEKLLQRKDLVAENVLNQQGYPEMAQSLAEVRTKAGLTPVTGGGVVITLNDSTVSEADDIAQSSLIHAQDVQRIVDQIKSYGAKAIAINGERLVNTSIIICTGPTIRINNVKHPVPFVITVISDDPSQLYQNLSKDSYILKRQSEHVMITVEEKQELSVPAFSDFSAIDLLTQELGGKTAQ